MEKKMETTIAGLDGYIYIHKLFKGFPTKFGVPFGGPYNKESSIVGSILGSPNFRKVPIRDVGPLIVVGICLEPETLGLNRG